jgi:hypothetical protein
MLVALGLLSQYYSRDSSALVIRPELLPSDTSLSRASDKLQTFTATQNTTGHSRFHCSIIRPATWTAYPVLQILQSPQFCFMYTWRISEEPEICRVSINDEKFSFSV